MQLSSIYVSIICLPSISVCHPFLTFICHSSTLPPSVICHLSLCLSSVCPSPIYRPSIHLSSVCPPPYHSQSQYGSSLVKPVLTVYITVTELSPCVVQYDCISSLGVTHCCSCHLLSFLGIIILILLEAPVPALSMLRLPGHLCWPCLTPRLCWLLPAKLLGVALGVPFPIILGTTCVSCVQLHCLGSMSSSFSTYS